MILQYGRLFPNCEVSFCSPLCSEGTHKPVCNLWFSSCCKIKNSQHARARELGVGDYCHKRYFYGKVWPEINSRYMFVQVSRRRQLFLLSRYSLANVVSGNTTGCW